MFRSIRFPCGGVPFALLFVVWAACVSAEEPAPPTPAEMVAAYKAGFARFSLGRARCLRSTVEDHSMSRRNAERLIASYDCLLEEDDGELTPEQRTMIRACKKDQEVWLTVLPPSPPVPFEFYTDGKSCQFRNRSDIFQPAAPFPDVVPTVANLATTFSDYIISSYSASLSSAPYRSWYGARRGFSTGCIEDKSGLFGSPFIPCLGSPPPRWADEKQWHPLDVVMSTLHTFEGPAERVTVDGRTLWRLSRRITTAKRPYDDQEGTKGFLETQAITVVTLDPERNFLPLSIERLEGFTFNGQVLNVGHDHRTETIEVTKIDRIAGVDYPTRTVVRSYRLDEAKFQVLPVSYYLDGSVVDVPVGLVKTDTFEVTELDATVPVPSEMFDLPFPDGTQYFDRRVNTTFVTGPNGPEPVRRR